MRFFRKWLRVILLFIPLVSFTQEEVEEYYIPENSLEEYKESELNPGKEIEETDWLKKIEGVDYTEERRKKKPPEEPEEEEEEVEPRGEEEDDTDFFSEWWEGLGTLLQILCILVLVAIVGYIIYLMTRLESNQSFVVEKSLEERLSSAEEELEESELEKLLRETIAQKNYKMAIRLYFLMMLNRLSEKNWIQYKKQKTNFLYLREMKGRSEYKRFRELTHTFEYSWYGEVEVDETIFSSLQTNYISFLNQLEA